MTLFLIETLLTTRRLYVVEAPDIDIAQDMVMLGDFEEAFSEDCVAENIFSSGEIDEENVPDIFYDENPLLKNHPYFTPETIKNRIYRYAD